jgi:site-specific recombinase XerD
MPASDALIQTIEQWITDLREANQSPQTVANHQYGMQSFVRWLDSLPEAIEVSQLTTTLLSNYVKYLLERRPRLRDSTIFAYIGVLVRWLDFLINDGKIPGIANHRGQVVTPDRVRTLLDRLVGKRKPLVAPRIPDLRTLPAYYHHELLAFVQQHGDPPKAHPPAILRTYLNLLRNRALIGVLFSTGGRVNEVLQLSVLDVWNGTTVKYTVTIKGKGKRERDLRLDDVAQDWIRAYLKARHAHFSLKDTPLFISHGPTAKGQQLSDVTAWRVVKDAAQAIADQWMTHGVAREEIQALRAVSPHSVRHFFAQAMLDEGANYDDIAFVLGHSSTKVTQQVYARLSAERTQEIADTYAPRATLSLEPRQP